jgi:hypothetical protein
LVRNSFCWAAVFKARSAFENMGLFHICKFYIDWLEIYIQVLFGSIKKNIPFNLLEAI